MKLPEIIIKILQKKVVMRSFIAIEISNQNVIDSIEKFQKENHFDAKSIEPKNLHFTLQFLGETSKQVSQKIINILQTIEFSSFDVNLNGISAFPSKKSPKIIWIGTDMKGGNLLIELAQKIQKLLEPLGFFSDKSFKPHITIFRIKKILETKQKNYLSLRKKALGYKKLLV